MGEFLIFQSDDGRTLLEATVRLFRTVQSEGCRSVERDVKHENLSRRDERLKNPPLAGKAVLLLTKRTP
jgi:hypothetical protein